VDSHRTTSALRERECLVVLTGCSHHGLVNMVETVAAEFPGTAIKVVVGGFHLAALPPFRGMSESATTVGGIGRSVLDLGVETTWTGHCTGTKAFAVLRSTMGDRVREIHTGSRLEL
jgi:7,8-dihydropterin-6-yl-methyl-4-(beta-D-ribofuranosyl)aminobenzene 5'-phosphate synthase